MEEVDLDTSWINNFEEEEKKYEIFYPEEIKNIAVKILYLNKNKTLEKISEKKIDLIEKNKLKKEELYDLIIKNNKIDKIKYKLVEILIYNITLQNEDIKYFLRDMNSINEERDLLNKYNFLSSMSSIEDYELQSSIAEFHNLNNIYMIFIEKEDGSKKNTKRIKFHSLSGKTRRKK